MEIMGFHNDGGFADFVIAPVKVLFRFLTILPR